MNRTVKVLLVIAVVCSGIEIACLVVNYLEPWLLDDTRYVETMFSRADVRWRVYWFGGLSLALTGYVLKKRFELAGFAVAIAGVYLMLLGNNAGIMGSGLIISRLLTSSITFLGLLVVIGRQRWSTLPAESQHPDAVKSGTGAYRADTDGE